MKCKKVLILARIGFKIRNLIWDKEGHYIMIKGSIKEEDITLNIYKPNTGVPKFIKQILQHKRKN